MPHIHTKKGQHDSTASALIFRQDFPSPKVVMHRHKKLGRYMQFGGHVELDETPWQAIVRELREESGYDISQLKILQPKVRIKSLTGIKLHPLPVNVDTHPIGDDHFHTDMKYIFITDQEPKHKIGVGESTDVRLFTASELRDFDDKETYRNLKQIIQFCFDNVLGNWEAVDPKEFIL